MGCAGVNCFPACCIEDTHRDVKRPSLASLLLPIELSVPNRLGDMRGGYAFSPDKSEVVLVRLIASVRPFAGACPLRCRSSKIVRSGLVPYGHGAFVMGAEGASAGDPAALGSSSEGEHHGCVGFIFAWAWERKFSKSLIAPRVSPTFDSANCATLCTVQNPSFFFVHMPEFLLGP